MNYNLRGARQLVVACGLLIGLAGTTVPVLADAPATPVATPVPVLQRGQSAAGTLVNQGGGGVSSYVVNGDGGSVTANVAFNGIGANAQSAFVTVWGPGGEVAAPWTIGSSASATFQTAAEQSYTVVVAVYQPIQQSDFAIALN